VEDEDSKDDNQIIDINNTSVKQKTLKKIKTFWYGKKQNEPLVEDKKDGSELKSFRSMQRSKLKENNMIDHMNPVMVKWELIVIILAVYSSIVLPLDIAFKPPALEDYRLKVFNNVIDLLFFLDIVMTFRTTQVNIMTGETITDPKVIANNYISGRFWIDLISTIPLDDLLKLFISNSMNENTLKKFVILSCLKLIRILRLSRLIDFLNQSDDFKL